ncbi:MAG: putative vacuolar protein sorting-associated protein 45, partial [Streblomastix strix]
LRIIDMIEDPITPLLFNFTYTAMLHDLFGLEQQMSVVVKKDHFAPDPNQIPEVFSPVYDEFFLQNIQSDICEDMMHFLDSFPELKAKGSGIVKHFGTISSIQQAIQRRSLYEFTEIEQLIVSNNSHSEALRYVEDAIDNNAYDGQDKLRLVMMYSIKYEQDRNNQIERLKQKLELQQIDKTDLIRPLLSFCGANSRSLNLNEQKKTDIQSIAKRLVQKFKDVPENVHQLHVPLIVDLIQQLLDGALQEDKFPSVPISTRQQQQPFGSRIKEQKIQQSSSSSTQQSEDPSLRNIIVFIVGGATYEESAGMKKFAEKGINIVVGGTEILNSKKFMEMIKEYMLATQFSM